MDLLDIFKEYLYKKYNSSPLTVKNYTADVAQFIRWQNELTGDFNPVLISSQTIENYKKLKISLNNNQAISARSLDRHLSSLRKFFDFLRVAELIESNPLEKSLIQKTHEDEWKIKEFKDFLFTAGASDLTIKNYINDIHYFTRWCQETLVSKQNYIVSTNVPSLINSDIIEDYKTRLTDIAGLSPLTINRKLSSIRKYCDFGQRNGILKSFDNISSNLKITKDNENISTIGLDELEKIHKETELAPLVYSHFPPLRLLQKLIFNPYRTLEDKIALKISTLPGFKKNLTMDEKNETQAAKKSIIHNIPKEFYAPHKISIANFPLWKRMVFHIKHTRPEWYKRYRKLSFSHYFHAALLIIFAVSIGIVLYQKFFFKPSINPLLAAAFSRTLSFQGKLTDAHDNPITNTSDIRFGIYNDQLASGSALLWQEVQSVTPNKDGDFSIKLGTHNPIPNSIFEQNKTLYLGLTVGSGTELSPRQHLADVNYATNSDFLQGMAPITQSQGTNNVILALDSSGNLTIGGSANPTFEAAGGQFKLSGQPLLLSTNIGSNGDIQLVPDGLGQIDIQAPLKNTSINNNIPSARGSVEVDDLFSILATSSGQSAFTIDQTGFGPLISASTSGIAKFTVDFTGGITNGTWNANAISSQYGGTGANLGSALQGYIPYFSGTGVMSALAAGSSGQCLITNGVGSNPTWGGCGSDSPWTSSNGALYPINSTEDFFVGGQATDSAKFSILGLDTGTPMVKVTTNSGDNALFFTADGTLGTTNNQILTLGNSSGYDTTGNILINPNGNGDVSIGTTTVANKLYVTGTSSSQATALIENADSGSSNVVLDLKDGALTPGQDNRFINFLDGNGDILGKIKGNGSSNSLTYDTNGGDFAEYFKKDNPDEVFGPGDLICSGQNGGATKCSAQNSTILGVYSTDAGFVGTGLHEDDPSYVLVGLIGQLPVTVSTENGNIHPGDMITVSNLTGIGQKTTQAGQVIGVALAEYDNNSPGTIPVRVNVSWYDPQADINASGNLTIIGTESNNPVLSNKPTAQSSQSANAADSSNNFVIQDAFGNIINTVGAFSQATVANLKVGAVGAIQIATNSLSVTTDSVTIAGKSLSSYITDTIGQFNKNSFVSPLVSTSELQTNIISPLSDGNITIDIGDSQNASNSAGRLIIKNQQDKEIASVDSNGNASFSGQLSASSFQTNIATISGNLAAQSGQINNLNVQQFNTSGDATISGTLHTNNIIADSIQGLDQKVSDIVKTITSTPPADADQSLLSPVVSSSGNQISQNQPPISGNLDILQPNFSNQYDISSISAEFALVSENLLSLGTATFNELSVAGSLSLGTTLTFNGSSINTLGVDLEINPLRQGNISFLGGLIKMDTDGNLEVSGNASFAQDVTVKGVLGANYISPLGDQNINIALNSQTNSAQKFQIKNASGSAVLAVDQSGNISASGSGTFAKLNFNLVQQALAVSDTESVATGSAGTAILKRYHTEITIDNSSVTDKSLIYITPVGDTQNMVISLLRQIPGQSFTVGISSPITKDILFNWIIVN